MLLNRLESVAVVLLIALTCTAVGVPTHTALAARPNETAQAKTNVEKLADAPTSAAKDQAKRTANSPILLGDAVDALNRKTKGHFDTKILRQPPLEKNRWPKPVTVDEVVSAIRGWDRKELPVADSTYRIFQQIADAKVLPPGARLDILDQWRDLGENDKYEYRIWRIQLDVMTGNNTGYTFVVREERLDRRNALLPAPGYSWLQRPLPAHVIEPSPLFVLAFEDDKDAALLITVAWTKKGVHELRPVAFDNDGNRYLPARQGWGSANSDLALLRFRLDPKKLPAAQVEHVGIEGITEESLKYASEAAMKRAQEKGIEVLPLPEVGKPYEFSVTTSDGKGITSRKLRRRVVLIDCWASWCGPCLRDMPEVKKVYERWHDKGLEVIGLSLDRDPKAAAAAAEKHEIAWPLVLVPPGEETRELWTQATRIESIPRLLVIDQKGVLRADLTSARDLEKIVAGLLAERPPAR
jgi:thiol-disulfide isomerase/thioredoxin